MDKVANVITDTCCVYGWNLGYLHLFLSTFLSR